MTELNARSQYALGGSDAEHDRLIQQAARLAPYTERFLRDAGIGPKQRVLDLGSGAGDVAILAARLVGPAGEVVGIERDTQAVARARVRVAEAGLHNVSFTPSDVSQIVGDNRFDAVVGRFILMFVDDPAAVLRSASQLVRPGGVVAFQEPSYAPFLLLSAHLPLWSRGVSLVHETLRRSGANTEMGFALYRTFQEAGLPPPTMTMEMPLGNDPDFTAWASDTLRSLRPQIQRLNLSLEGLGDFDTLADRLQAEIAGANTVVPWQGLVGAWSRVPFK
jgi:SAM-dependent methyltransferase